MVMLYFAKILSHQIISTEFLSEILYSRLMYTHDDSCKYALAVSLLDRFLSVLASISRLMSAQIAHRNYARYQLGYI